MAIADMFLKLAGVTGEAKDADHKGEIEVVSWSWGLQATTAIRENELSRGGHVPILAMTAYAMKGDRERCLEAGMDDYIAKPIRSEEMFQAIARLVGAVLEPLFAPGDINENLLHRAGRGLEEMPAIGEVLVAISSDLQPGLMHERRRLEGLPSFLIGHQDDRQLAQFLIDQWEQLVGSLRLAGSNGVEHLSQLGHGVMI